MGFESVKKQGIKVVVSGKKLVRVSLIWGFKNMAAAANGLQPLKTSIRWSDFFRLPAAARAEKKWKSNDHGYDIKIQKTRLGRERRTISGIPGAFRRDRIAMARNFRKRHPFQKEAGGSRRDRQHTTRVGRMKENRDYPANLTGGGRGVTLHKKQPEVWGTQKEGFEETLSDQRASPTRDRERGRVREPMCEAGDERGRQTPGIPAKGFSKIHPKEGRRQKTRGNVKPLKQNKDSETKPNVVIAEVRTVTGDEKEKDTKGLWVKEGMLARGMKPIQDSAWLLCRLTRGKKPPNRSKHDRELG